MIDQSKQLSLDDPLARTIALLDLDLDCCSRPNEVISDTTVLSQGFVCSSCEVSGGELPSQHLSLQFKESGVVRIDLDRMEMGANDELQIDGSAYDVVHFDSLNNVFYQSVAAYLYLNRRPVNKTLWDLIPFEAKTAVFGFIVAALGFKRSHIVRFIGRALGKTDGGLRN